MAYINNLTAYVNGNPEIVISDILLGAPSFDLLRVETGIKGTEKRPDMANGSTVLQTGDYTNPALANGGINLNEVTISTKEIWIKEFYSQYGLNKTIAQLALKAGSNVDDVPYVDTMMAIKGASIKQANEQLIWQGDVSSGVNNLKWFNGLDTICKASANVIKTGAVAVALTPANAISEVNKLVDKMNLSLPQFLSLDNVRLFMSPSNFQTYTRALFGTNGTVNQLTMNTGKPLTEVMVPGTNVIATSMYGLVGSNSLILTRSDNFIVATDLESDTDKMTFDWVSYVQSYQLFTAYKLGVAICREGEVIINKA